MNKKCLWVVLIVLAVELAILSIIYSVFFEKMFGIGATIYYG